MFSEETTAAADDELLEIEVVREPTDELNEEDASRYDVLNVDVTKAAD